MIPQISLEAQLLKRVHRGETFRCSRSFRVPPGLFPAKALFVNRGRLKRLLLLRAASSSKGDVGPRRRVYTESQGQDPLPLGRVKEFAAFAVPAGAFLAITLGSAHARCYSNLFLTILLFILIRVKFLDQSFFLTNEGKIIMNRKCKKFTEDRKKTSCVNLSQF